MYWCFAKVNGRLAEIYFYKKKPGPKFFGHAYVKSVEYKTKKELAMIGADTAKFKFSYRAGKYKRLS